MFVDEIKQKLAVAGDAIPFSICMLSRGKLVVSGIKNVLSVSDDAVVLKLRGETLSVRGEALKIAEIGGGDAYIRGIIGGLEFEKTPRKE